MSATSLKRKRRWKRVFLLLRVRLVSCAVHRNAPIHESPGFVGGASRERLKCQKNYLQIVVASRHNKSGEDTPPGGNKKTGLRSLVRWFLSLQFAIRSFG